MDPPAPDESTSSENARASEISRTQRALTPSTLTGGPSFPPQIGRYRVLRRIGEGGMGVVFAAHDRDLDRQLAVKLVRTIADRSGNARQRLLREAQALARISHPNVVHVYEVGTFGDQVFIAMEFVDGETLRAWQWRENTDWKAVLEAYVAAGRGLAAAHAIGMVHRDFKPENVLVTRDDKVRVIDFGLARHGNDPLDDAAPAAVIGAKDRGIDLSKPMTVLTETGAVVGTPAYMGPEQHRGSVSDARTDQFAYCVSLYEALYGERPFAGDSFVELAANVLQGQVQPEPRFVRVPHRVRRILLRGLSNDPAQRYPDMNALIADLRRDPRRSLLRAAAIAVLGLVILLGAGVGWLLSHERQLRHEAVSLQREWLAGNNRWTDGPSRQRVRSVLMGVAADLDESHADSAVRRLVTLAETPITQADLHTARLLARETLSRGIRTNLPSSIDAAIENRVLSLHGSNDGGWLALCTERALLIWNEATHRIGRRREHCDSEARISIAGGTGDVVWSTSRSGTEWIGRDGETLRIREPGPISAIAISHDGATLAVAGGEGIGLWRLADGRSELLRRLVDHHAKVHHLSFSDDGSFLASIGEDGRLIRWNLGPRSLRTVELREEVRTLVHDRMGSIWLLQADGTVRQWPESGGPITSMSTGVTCLASDDLGIVAIHADGTALTFPDRNWWGSIPNCHSLVLSPGGVNSILDADDRLERWRVESGMLPDPIGASSESIRDVDPLGRFAVVEDSRQQARVVWIAAQERPALPLQLPFEATEIIATPTSVVARSTLGGIARVPIDGGTPLLLRAEGTMGDDVLGIVASDQYVAACSVLNNGVVVWDTQGTARRIDHVTAEDCRANMWIEDTNAARFLVADDVGGARTGNLGLGETSMSSRRLDFVDGEGSGPIVAARFTDSGLQVVTRSTDQTDTWSLWMQSDDGLRLHEIQRADAVEAAVSSRADAVILRSKDAGTLVWLTDLGPNTNLECDGLPIGTRFEVRGPWALLAPPNDLHAPAPPARLFDLGSGMSRSLPFGFEADPRLLGSGAILAGGPRGAMLHTLAGPTDEAGMKAWLATLARSLGP